jgi:TusA-related sulfurtransferase
MRETYPEEWSFDDEFDSGDETCGRVIINLHSYVKPLAPGTRLMLISKDPAAPVEFPAWCRMTRNTLLESVHPFYLIELKPGQKEKEHG